MAVMSWKFEVVAGPFGRVTEGPAWDGETLLFTHINGSHILRYDPRNDNVTEFRTGTDHANGLMFDLDGRLYGCEGGARRVVRYEPDGSTTVLADNFAGKRLNMPNDLAIDPHGRIWFTDPYYPGAAGPLSREMGFKELDHDSVYSLIPQDDGWFVTRATYDTGGPNGLLFSLDYHVLYVAESCRESWGKRELRAYPVCDDGSLGPCTVLHDFGEHRGIDGMCLDTEGNIVATAGSMRSGPGPMIYVISPSGDVLATHDTPEDQPTNCTFGGVGLSTLYVTTFEGFLLQARTEHQGRLLFP